MACDKPNHAHSWSTDGELEIERCEHYCLFCTGVKAQKRWSSAWFLRRHVRETHAKGEFSTLVVSEGWARRPTGNTRPQFKKQRAPGSNKKRAGTKQQHCAAMQAASTNQNPLQLAGNNIDAMFQAWLTQQHQQAAQNIQQGTHVYQHAIQAYQQDTQQDTQQPVNVLAALANHGFAVPRQLAQQQPLPQYQLHLQDHQQHQVQDYINTPLDDSQQLQALFDLDRNSSLAVSDQASQQHSQTPDATIFKANLQPEDSYTLPVDGSFAATDPVFQQQQDPFADTTDNAQLIEELFGPPSSPSQRSDHSGISHDAAQQLDALLSAASDESGTVVNEVSQQHEGFVSVPANETGAVSNEAALQHQLSLVAPNQETAILRNEAAEPSFLPLGNPSDDHWSFIPDDHIEWFGIDRPAVTLDIDALLREHAVQSATNPPLSPATAVAVAADITTVQAADSASLGSTQPLFVNCLDLTLPMMPASTDSPPLPATAFAGGDAGTCFTASGPAMVSPVGEIPTFNDGADIAESDVQFDVFHFFDEALWGMDH